MSELKAETIQEWKKKYGKVMKAVLGGVEYYYRPIDLSEYYLVQTKSSESESNSEAVGQEAIVKIAVLHPDMPEVIPAGVTFKLSDEILKISGFTEELKPEEI